MRAVVKTKYEFEENEIKAFMQNKGYVDFSEQELAYELSRCNDKDLEYWAFRDIDDKEIIIEK